ncbi:MAG: prolyl oligopeptidase family serine peptidase [Bacteroidota bacterium]
MSKQLHVTQSGLQHCKPLWYGVYCTLTGLHLANQLIVSILWAVLLLLASAQLQGQTPTNQSSLTIEQIMQGEAFVGYLPQGISWSEDSKSIYFSWNPEGDTLRSQYQIAATGGKAQKMTVAAQKARAGRGDYNKDYSKKVYAKNGDLFLLEVSSNTTQQLTNTIDRESNPQFSGDGQHIVFTKGDNVYSWHLNSGAVTQLTNFKKGKERKEAGLPAQQQWLEDDQLTEFDILRERDREDELRKEQREALQLKRPTEVYYGKKRLSNFGVSPNMRYVTVRLTTSADAKRTKVPDFVTESGYLKDLNARAKVGSPQDTYEMGIYDTERDTFYLLDTEQIEGIRTKPSFLYNYHTGEEAFQTEYDNAKEVIIHGPYFSEDGKAAVVVRSMDNKDRWIMLLDLEKGSLTTLDWQHDEAWIGGPGISGWNFYGGTMGWLPDNKHLYFQSESTGFSHLYTVDVTTGERTPITNGKYEVHNVQLSRDGAHFFITASKEGPHEHHFYRVSTKGGKLEKLTDKAGRHDVTLSPDKKMMAIRYSYSNQPWELYVQETKAGAKMRKLTNSLTPAFKKYDWRAPEIVRFTAEDGAKVPARLYRPKKGAKGGPAVIFVHGAGYLQNVHQWWSSYYREYMFHNMLTDNGYTVLDIDYRASAGYGRNWRTGIYQFMGGKDLDDQVDGAKYLVEELGVDADRIGIYGGSYGGFITLMAQFTKPGTFKSGAALRSVTDWAHYNHAYTSNILNTPVEDPEAYRKSSPIYHAEGLQDHLLILHGMVDTNVQFQDVVRLAQRLIELGKDNWEFAVFPMEGHGFVEPSSWADEYKRIYKLFEETLK